MKERIQVSIKMVSDNHFKITAYNGTSEIGHTYSTSKVEATKIKDMIHSGELKV